MDNGEGGRPVRQETEEDVPRTMCPAGWMRPESAAGLELRPQCIQLKECRSNANYVASTICSSFSQTSECFTAPRVTHAPSNQSLYQYSMRWTLLSGLMKIWNSSDGPPHESCHLQYPSRWSVNVFGST